MALQRPVILMRPGEANNRLASMLHKEGIKVLALASISD